ncbi:dTDP-4-dehydrorhamnose 3,5-epimerase family protein [Streptomyces aureocirculatus]|uniref:dTDP-4-dehydrorhamnose 3,5-epimerase family protein n=1 Tax=Streptomyces aureocirculatus TaxID=67275 RepID=UPI0018FEAD35|nr:dTDP-4-dehydrorhamnose 3,5-epimerase family protein [Streptomyces aureocirculatus]
MRPLALEGAWEIVPQVHADERGAFLEYFRPDLLAEVTGRHFDVAQSSLSSSAPGVVRGIHFADVPPGQAKYVTCVRGAVFDVVVDIRTGSPTYGRWQAVRLDDTGRSALLIEEGLGHAFCALTDDALMLYLCSETYAPQREHVVQALDDELGIPWPVDTPVQSPRDAAAPLLADALAKGLLPSYEMARKHSA